jgi:VWFA-related protein
MIAIVSVATLLAAGASTAPRFSTESDAIRLDVVVSRRGEPIGGLRAADFEVVDNGVVRRVELASRIEESVHGVLVLDVSGSVEGEPLAKLQAAAGTFVSSLEPTDKVTLLTFSNRLRRVIGPTDPATAQAALASLQVENGTALHDAALAGLLLSRTAPGRPFVLLFTDGYDYLSWLPPDDVLQAARESDTTVYLVCTAPIDKPDVTPAAGVSPPSWVSMAAGRHRFLTSLVGETGGRIWTPGRGIREAFLEVLAEVKNRYLLVFERDPQAHRGWHELKVRLKNRKGDVRARKGYFVH